MSFLKAILKNLVASEVSSAVKGSEFVKKLAKQTARVEVQQTNSLSRGLKALYSEVSSDVSNLYTKVVSDPKINGTAAATAKPYTSTSVSKPPS